MLIPGIPDEHLARLHWNNGSGRGILGYRHLPSGIFVTRPCPEGMPVMLINAELLVELEERLKSEGRLAGPVA